MRLLEYGLQDQRLKLSALERKLEIVESEQTDGDSLQLESLRLTRNRSREMVHAIEKGLAVEQKEIVEISNILFKTSDGLLADTGRRHQTGQTLKGLEALQTSIQSDLQELRELLGKLVSITYSAPGMQKKIDEMERRLHKSPEVLETLPGNQDYFTGGSWQTSHAISVAGRAEHVIGGGATEAQLVVPTIHDQSEGSRNNIRQAASSEQTDETSEEQPVLRPCVAVVDFEPLEGYASQMLRLSAGDQILLAGQV
eukprot:GHVS01064503.1.p1 GENE.GHVS01064503.1~~GHVS01064503.1.p1  ORF type:complete len:255 (-),score=29.17 GHVS01064503.1:855-1619(-)